MRPKTLQHNIRLNDIRRVKEPGHAEKNFQLKHAARVQILLLLRVNSASGRIFIRMEVSVIAYGTLTHSPCLAYTVRGNSCQGTRLRGRQEEGDDEEDGGGETDDLHYFPTVGVLADEALLC